MSDEHPSPFIPSTNYGGGSMNPLVLILLIAAVVILMFKVGLFYGDGNPIDEIELGDTFGLEILDDVSRNELHFAVLVEYSQEQDDYFGTAVSCEEQGYTDSGTFTLGIECGSRVHADARFVYDPFNLEQVIHEDEMRTVQVLVPHNSGEEITSVITRDQDGTPTSVRIDVFGENEHGKFVKPYFFAPNNNGWHYFSDQQQ